MQVPQGKGYLMGLLMRLSVVGDWRLSWKLEAAREQARMCHNK